MGTASSCCFEFAEARVGVTPSSLALEQLDSGLVSAFLEYLEDTPKRSRDPQCSIGGHRVLLPLPRVQASLPRSIKSVASGDPLQKDRSFGSLSGARGSPALLDAPDPATRDGIRDRAMLHLAVSDLTGLRIDDVALPSKTGEFAGGC